MATETADKEEEKEAFSSTGDMLFRMSWVVLLNIEVVQALEGLFFYGSGLLWTVLALPAVAAYAYALLYLFRINSNPLLLLALVVRLAYYGIELLSSFELMVFHPLGSYTFLLSLVLFAVALAFLRVEEKKTRNALRLLAYCTVIYAAFSSLHLIFDMFLYNMTIIVIADIAIMFLTTAILAGRDSEELTRA